MTPPPVIEALAAGFRAGGARLCANHPGFHSHRLAAELGCPVTSRSERAAMAFGWGASLAGARTVVTIKNVGLDDATDPFVNALFVGCNGGFVVVVFDDIEIEQSQLPHDSRVFSALPGGIWLEPRSVADAGRWAAHSFELSERFNAPVVLRITNLLCHAAADKQPVAVDPLGERQFVRQPERWVVHPANSARLAGMQRERCARIQAWSDAEPVKSGMLQAGRPLALLVGAVPLDAAAGADWLAIDRLPLPAAAIAACRQASRVTVHEHGRSHVAGMVAAALVGDRVQALPYEMADVPRSYHDRDWYEPLFGPLRSLPDRVVIGDLGSHTMDPARSIDACLCYGASVAVAAGVAAAAPDRRVICVTGDGAFAHSGAAGLAEAVDRGVALVVLVIDNGGCRDTGGQRISMDWPVASAGLRVVEREFDVASPCRIDEVAAWLAAGGTTVVRCRFGEGCG
jgi:indolepyruvate ferredoxin oxidoreductase alpha subunit